MLAGWGYNQKLEIRINRQKLISASIDGNLLQVKYSGDFKDWGEFKDNQEVIALRSKASDPLKRTVEGDKGFGKCAASPE